jgi:flagellar M-ring protein FliF
MKKILANLSLSQRITIAVTALAVIGGIYYLVHWQKEADFKPLFTGVAPEDAAAIIQKLKEGGVEYRLPEGGGSVLVPSNRVAEMRLNLAAAGLPKTGRIGFELFDKSNLGATEFTEHINYRRALEGELERSIMSLAEIEQARVHLTFPKDSVFLDAQQPAKASVLVGIRPGSRLATQNVMAINHLVASAVEGLSPNAVSVLDMNGNLLGRPKPAGGLDGPEGSEAALDYRHKVEQDLLAKVNGTLEPLLGSEKFRAGVSVDCDFSGVDQSEEIFDPAKSVMSSSERTEDSTGGAAAAGVPGTPSTLPRPASRPAGSSNRTSRVTENIIYQTSRTVKKTRLPAGGIRKISLSVLVDQEVTWQPDKNGFQRVLVPPSADKLKVIRDLVAGVTGFNADRGDQLVIETLPFESTLQLEPPQRPKQQAPQTTRPPRLPQFWPIKWDRNMMMIAGGVGLVVLLAGFFLFRRKRRKAGVTEVSIPAALPEGDTYAPAVAAAPGSPAVERQLESKLAQREALQQKMDAQVLNALKLAPVITKAAEVLAKHLREKVKLEPDLSAQILRSWIRDEEN